MRRAVGGYKWFLLALLGCAFFFHQADRALFGLLTKPIQDELGLTDVHIGWINTALSWTLAAMTMLAGFAGDRFSRKWIITVSLVFWSLMTVMMGFVGEWRIFGVVVPAYLTVMFFRSIATGGGESFYAPSAMALLGAHHKETRSLAFSVHQGVLYFALMTSGLIVAAALRLMDWRHIFMVFGGAGCLLGVSFIWLLRDEPRATRLRQGYGGQASHEPPAFAEATAGRRTTNHEPRATNHEPPAFAEATAGRRTTSHEPRATNHEPRTTNLLAGGFKAFFLNPAALCVTTGFVAIVFVNNAYLFWAPKFIAEKFAVDVGEAATKAMFWHHLAAFAAVMAGGALTDRLVARHPRFRLAFQATAMLLGAPCLALIGLSGSLSAMVAMTAAYGLCRGLFESNTHASLFDVIPPEYRSSAEGYLTMVGFFFGGLSGICMGWLSDRYGVRGFEIGFAIMGGAYAVGALATALSYFCFFRKVKMEETA